MELTAVLEGLSALKESCRLTIVTDSQYVQRGITQWMHTWKRNGWRTAAKEPVKNQDLWQALDRGLALHRVTWQWVKGHARHADNIRADRLAYEAAQRVLASELL
jgi:ribonuclease HI